MVWLVGDHHGTAQISVNAVGQAVAIRRETPFGTLRSTTGTWPAAMDKGFVGGTNDNTGLTHLGAREYDPLIGRFISVDPVIDNDDPQQMHGYAYANNAPVTASDADGMWPKLAQQGGQRGQQRRQHRHEGSHQHGQRRRQVGLQQRRHHLHRARRGRHGLRGHPAAPGGRTVPRGRGRGRGAIDTYKSCASGAGTRLCAWASPA